MRRSWLIAGTVHAAALFALSRVPIRVVVPPPAPEIEVPIEMTAELSPAQGSTAAPEPAPATAPGAAGPAPPRIARITRVPSERPAVTPPSPDDPNEAASPAPATVGDGVVTLPGRPTELGLGAAGQNPFLPKSEAEVTLAETKRSVDRAMKDPAREREMSLGLGPEGPVLTALAEATSRSTAPVRGKAVFVATADENGVYQIELRDADGSRAGWDDARTIALAALKGRKLRLPPGSTRAVMRIEVKSDWKLPSGHDPNPEISLFHIPLKKGETKESAKVSILDPIPKVRMQDVWIDKNTRIAVPSVQLDLFHTNMDPTDIGAKPRRVVHSHLMDAQVM
jgi:hypothetical protein